MLDDLMATWISKLRTSLKVEIEGAVMDPSVTSEIKMIPVKIVEYREKNDAGV